MQLREREILAKIISLVLGLGVSFSITYFGVKYLTKALDPTRKDKEKSKSKAERLMRSLGLKNVELNEYELCIASNLVDPSSIPISWDDIGGLDDIIEDLKDTVILPFRLDLGRESSLAQPPKGVLLYGPPGCGKTMIAKAMAKAAEARFINLEMSSLFDKWYGESQKRAEAVFSVARKLQPAIIFIDEIDAFLRNRTSSDHEATAMIKTQFMSSWDGLMTDEDCRIMIVGATNRPHDVDAAIMRRMPSTFEIGLPSIRNRRRILDLVLRSENLSDNIDLYRIAEMTKTFSGSDLRELCRQASVFRVRDLVKSYKNGSSDVYQSDVESGHKLRPLAMEDFTKSMDKIKASKMAHLGVQAEPLD
ncbi:DgyrCDS11851 [Dimorphilus gyrociliatus]|uniref:DgyrCDS11851 n=1 Tax=Dimorphilus gyrociliatus TaxID=2664684 RepID=A0A7I8W8C4_9ANNE|nr:DgyrCDS11851 [Dimorphilus gyrociliatus]